MKQQLKLIIKQVIAEELQQEGKGFGKVLGLGALLGFGAAKLGSHSEQPPEPIAHTVKFEKGHRSNVGQLGQELIDAKNKAIQSVIALANQGDQKPRELARNPLFIQIKNVSARDIGLEDLRELNRLIQESGISTEETEEFSDMLATH